MPTAPKKAQPEKAAAPAEKPKRKMPTVAERVAAAEAKLAELRAKAEAKANKETEKQRERLATLVAKRDKLTAEIEAITSELGDSTTTESAEGNGSPVEG